MFDKKVYAKRREELHKKLNNGILLFPGNNESAMNYAGNTYHYRQDSSFLYFFGLDMPGLAGICDLDEKKDTLYGDDITMDDIIWMGDQPSMKERAEKVGVENTKPSKMLKNDLLEALKTGRRIHILPPYRGDHLISLADLFELNHHKVKDFISEDFIKAVISLREVKDEHEIQEMEEAADTAYQMHTSVMKMAFPGTWEREIAGMVEGIAIAHGGAASFPVILSMDGQTLHNHYHGNLLKEGRMVVTDAGAESILHYASDITRTVPVGGKFNQRQKEIYEIVLKANVDSIKAVKPGISNRDLHLGAAKIIASGLKDLGFLKGSVDDIVSQGAHALFFPHGLGHMLGLDVHDMENLGENLVGYNDEIKRSTQFGINHLRLGKKLQEGFVITIEPGIYFIPALIDLWRSEGKFKDMINYDLCHKYKDFGGIRIEDDVLVTADSYRVLGKPIPKKVEEIEKVMAGN
jgi:Xaa-Pro aminopeptidase